MDQIELQKCKFNMGCFPQHSIKGGKRTVNTKYGYWFVTSKRVEYTCGYKELITLNSIDGRTKGRTED